MYNQNLLKKQQIHGRHLSDRSRKRLIGEYQKISPLLFGFNAVAVTRHSVAHRMPRLLLRWRSTGNPMHTPVIIVWHCHKSFDIKSIECVAQVKYRWMRINQEFLLYTKPLKQVILDHVDHWYKDDDNSQYCEYLSCAQRRNEYSIYSKQSKDDDCDDVRHQ